MKKVFNTAAKPVLKIMPDGEKRWLLNGKLHCEDGPAAICPDGTKIWALHGKRQRADGPSVIFADGTKFWHKDNLMHREDGPAVEYANGDRVWYRNGKIHREDGPAMMLADGTQGWYLNGRPFNDGDENGDNEKKFLAAKAALHRKKAAKLERDVRDATILQAPIKVGSALRLKKGVTNAAHKNSP